MHTRSHNWPSPIITIWHSQHHNACYQSVIFSAKRLNNNLQITVKFPFFQSTWHKEPIKLWYYLIQVWKYRNTNTKFCMFIMQQVTCLCDCGLVSMYSRVFWKSQVTAAFLEVIWSFKGLNMQNCFYRCSAWPLNVREKHRLRVWQNKPPRYAFRSHAARDKVKGRWKK